MLVRQFQCLSDSMVDPCPMVRVAAAEGICSILNLYWEIIPSATTAGYVSRLTGGCVSVCVCVWGGGIWVGGGGEGRGARGACSSIVTFQDDDPITYHDVCPG